MKKLLAVFLCLLMVCQLMACSGGKKEEAVPNPNLGLYTLTEAAMNDISIPVDSVYEGGFTVLLRENGKAELTVDNQSANGTWTLDGTKFSVKGGGLDLSGTLDNGVMTIDNAMDSGITLTLYLEGFAPLAAPSVAAAPEEPAEPEPTE